MVEIFVQFAIEKKITLRRRENLKTFILRERKKKIIGAMDFNEWARGKLGGEAGRDFSSRRTRGNRLDWACKGEKVEEGRREGEQKERKEGDILDI